MGNSLMIKIGHYAELRLIAWNRHPDDWIEESEALALYEANWRLVDVDRMNAAEKALLECLVREHGAGVLNV